jgi:hypothetical protein
MLAPEGPTAIGNAAWNGTCVLRSRSVPLESERERRETAARTLLAVTRKVEGMFEIPAVVRPESNGTIPAPLRESVERDGWPAGRWFGGAGDCLGGG